MAWALVTGASGGIGSAVCVKLAAMGLDVFVHYHTHQERAQHVAQQIEQMGRVAVLVPCDVSNAAQTEQVLKNLFEQHAAPDVLVNNAGRTKDALFALMGSGSWDEVIRTNLDSFYHVTRPVVRQMLKKRYGRVVSVASVVGLHGNVGQAHYAASKAGLIGASKSVALEVASRGITVNVVAPGMVATHMTEHLDADTYMQHIPMKRYGTPEEVAHAVGFLCSEEARYITGEVLTVGGGLGI
jgi:3-oxoacyl-[acyl-carrier protein] reductase